MRRNLRFLTYKGSGGKTTLIDQLDLRDCEVVKRDWFTNEYDRLQLAALQRFFRSADALCHLPEDFEPGDKLTISHTEMDPLKDLLHIYLKVAK